jgi:uncharacterized membrane protein YbaN (DUF454 family)
MSGIQITEAGTSVQIKIKKGAYFIIGSIALIAGIIGAFLPVLPTTPFILLSAWCYIRSSEKVYDWLINNEKFGKTIEDYHTGKGITKSTKTKSISMMWLAIIISSYIYIEKVWLVGILLLTAISVTAYIMKQPTAE